MKTKATLKNISDLLQISISTVSRALKDHPDIAEQTKKKVRELAEIMDYEPNAFAIYLRTNASLRRHRPYAIAIFHSPSAGNRSRLTPPGRRFARYLEMFRDNGRPRGAAPIRANG